MARLFDDAVPEYLSRDSAVISSAPLTMSLWFNSNDGANFGALCMIGDKDTDNQDRWMLLAAGGGGADLLRFQVVAGGVVGEAITSSGYTANTWHHLIGIEISSSSRSVLLDGGNKGTDATNLSPGNIDRISVAIEGDSGLNIPFSGASAEIGIWNVGLSDGEGLSLSKGFSPLWIQPHNLVAYYPLIRDDDNDLIGVFDLTAVNTPTVATHPPKIIYPAYKG